MAAIDKFYETYDIRIFAPSHTNVIRKDLPRYMESLREAMRMAITGDSIWSTDACRLSGR